MNTQFELRFEGPKDDSAPTLRRIKGVFVADLEFPASDVQRFLENAPIVIKTADSENDLKKTHELLEKAGAKVLIVRQTPPQVNNGDTLTTDINNPLELELSSLPLEFDSVLTVKPTETVSVDKDDINALELSFDFSSGPNTEVVEQSEQIKETANNMEEADNSDSSSFDLSFSDEDEQPSPFEIKSPSTLHGSTEKLKEEEQESEFNLSLATHDPLEKVSDGKINASNPPATIEVPENLSISSELELEVVTPANSTIFGVTDSPTIKSTQSDSYKSELVASLATESVVKQEYFQEAKADPTSISEVATEVAVESPAIQSIEEEEEPLVELTLDQLASLRKGPPKPFKLPLLPLLVFIGLGTLYLINSWLFSAKTYSNPFFAMLENLPKLVAEPNSQEQAKLMAEKAAELAQSLWYSSEQNFPNRSVKAIVWVENSIPVHASIEITTPQPAALSKEEIVNNIPLRPWLRRLEIKDLVFKNVESNLVATGPALAYFSSGEKNIRMAGKANIKATVDMSNKTIQLEVQAQDKDSIIQDSSPSKQPRLDFTMGEPSKELSQKLSFFEIIELKHP